MSDELYTQFVAFDNLSRAGTMEIGRGDGLNAEKHSQTTSLRDFGFPKAL